MTTIKLGQRVRDLTTGFEGIAVNKTLLLNGCIQFGIQPPAKDGVYPESISIDENLLEVVDEGVSAKVTPQTFISPIVLGNTVKDIITGIQGIAITKSDCLNGCALFQVEHKGEGFEANKDYMAWIEQSRLSVVDEGVVNKLLKAPKAADGKMPGGPVMRNVPRG